MKPGDRVILEEGQAVVKAVKLVNTEVARIEWRGVAALDLRNEYFPGEMLQVLGR